MSAKPKRKSAPRKSAAGNKASPLRQSPQLRGPYGAPANIVPPSGYIRYDQPPIIRADRIVILPDIQFPYHHADFLNKVLYLCHKWNVRHAILAGDVIENSALTHFDPNWEGEGKLSEEVVADLVDIISGLPEKTAQKVRAVIEKHGAHDSVNPGGISEEWGHARKALRRLVDQFDEIVWELGNHEGRILRQLQSPTSPEEIKRLFLGDMEKVKISPYYYCIVESGNTTWRIIHPKSSAKGDARWYAAKYLTNVVMAHSHQWMMQKDRSGMFWAIETGMIVDEARLPYVAQRDNKADRHLLGATIIVDGNPWLLHDGINWERLAQMK